MTEVSCVLSGRRQHNPENPLAHTWGVAAKAVSFVFKVSPRYDTYVHGSVVIAVAYGLEPIIMAYIGGR